MKNDNYLQTLEDRKAKMIQYLLLKVEEQDWHAVCDAGMDLRDIESEMVGYKKGNPAGYQEALYLLDTLPNLDEDPAYEKIRKFLERIK